MYKAPPFYEALVYSDSPGFPPFEFLAGLTL